jgi:hypothetical protein
MLTREAFMTTSSTPEDTIAECKRRANECYALLESAIVPESGRQMSDIGSWLRRDLPRDQSARDET